MAIKTTILKVRRKNSKYYEYKTNFPKQLGDLIKIDDRATLEWSQYGDSYLVRIIK